MLFSLSRLCSSVCSLVSALDLLSHLSHFFEWIWSDGSSDVFFEWVSSGGSGDDAFLMGLLSRLCSPSSLSFLLSHLSHFFEWICSDGSGDDFIEWVCFGGSSDDVF